MLDAEDDIYLHDQFLRPASCSSTPTSCTCDPIAPPVRTRQACVPLGGVTGALVGVLNQMFRYGETHESYHKVRCLQAGDA